MQFQDMRRTRKSLPDSQRPVPFKASATRPLIAASATYRSPLENRGNGNGGWLDRATRRPTVRRTICLVIVGVLVLGLAAFAVVHAVRKHPAPATAANATAQNKGSTAAETPATSPTTISLLATGDFIAHDSVNNAAKKADGTYDYLPMMADFTALFKQSDIRFCNDPILNGGAQFGIIGYPKFNSPTEFVTDMGRLGCNLVNTASNHSFDKTQDVISASVHAWDGVPHMLAMAGQNRTQAEHDAIHYFTIKGVKFAFLAYTTYSNTAPQNSYGVNVFTQDFAKQQISTARQSGAQAIIVSMRWGTEYSGQVNAVQKQDAQFLADQGVDLVLGHGPHVLQTVTQLTGSGGNKTTVWYSLGNFINTQEPPETLFSGLALMQYDIKTKQFIAPRYLPVYMHYEWTAAQAATDTITARNHLHLYLLEDATQAMIDSQQLKTTIAAQKQRISSTLNADGLIIPLITSKDY